MIFASFFSLWTNVQNDLRLLKIKSVDMAFVYNILQDSKTDSAITS